MTLTKIHAYICSAHRLHDDSCKYLQRVHVLILLASGNWGRHTAAAPSCSAIASKQHCGSQEGRAHQRVCRFVHNHVASCSDRVDNSMHSECIFVLLCDMACGCRPSVLACTTALCLMYYSHVLRRQILSHVLRPSVSCIEMAERIGGNALCVMLLFCAMIICEKNILPELRGEKATRRFYVIHS